MAGIQTFLTLSKKAPQPVIRINLNSESVNLGRPSTTSIFSTTLADPVKCEPDEVIYLGVGDAALANTIYTIIEGVNDKLGYNGSAAGEVTLAPGYYTGTTIAAEIQSKLNLVPGAVMIVQYNTVLNKLSFSRTSATITSIGGAGTGGNTIDAKNSTLYAQLGLTRQAGDPFFVANGSGILTLTNTATDYFTPFQLNLIYQRLNVYIRLSYIKSLETVAGECVFSNLFDKIPVGSVNTLAYAYNIQPHFQQLQTKTLSDISGVFTDKSGSEWPSNFPWSMTLIALICENQRYT